MIDQSSRTHSLASCYENTFTTVVRLGSLSPAMLPAVEVFRQNIAGALRASRDRGKSLGYASEANNSAFFAAVAFLDESVLRLQNPGYAVWAQRPLQEELFNHNRAGEIFFDNLRGLLLQEDSQDTADCLEIYCLCLLLGFRGRYSAGIGASRPSGEIDSLIRQAREKISRVRGRMLFLREDEPAPAIKQMATVDQWSRGLGIAALCLLVVVLLMYGGFWALLSSGASQAL